MNPAHLAGLWARPSWGWYHGTGAYPGAHGWERAAAWPGCGDEAWSRLQVLLRKAPVTSEPPPTISSSQPSSPTTSCPAAEAQRPVPLQLGAGRTKKPPHCKPSLGREEISREQRPAQWQIRAGSSSRVPLSPPASQAGGTGPCAVHAHQFLPPSYRPRSNSSPFLHPTAIPLWPPRPHYPLHVISIFPSWAKQAGTAQEGRRPSQPGSRTQTCPELTLWAQDSGWQGLHAAAARFVLVSVLGAGKRRVGAVRPGKALGRHSAAPEAVGKVQGCAGCQAGSREGKLRGTALTTQRGRRWQQPYLHPSSLSTEGERTGERSDNS